MDCKNKEQSELKGRFTNWLKIVAYRARRSYLKASSKPPVTIPLEKIPEKLLCIQESRIIELSDDTEFNFEEERLAQAFSCLPAMKKRVLTMLFVLEKTPDEVADELGCTVQNVYNQRSLAIKLIRASLDGGEHHEE